MDQLKEITKKINEILLIIEQDYPGLYQYLDENPVTIPNKNHPDINTKNMSIYLESLKGLLQHHIESHRLKTKK